jgi:hypothetical protein
LSRNEGDNAWPSFRIVLDLTDAEIMAIQQIALRKQRNIGARRRGLNLLVAAVAVGLLGGWLLTEARVVQPSDEGFVSVVFFLVYWLGFTTMVILAGGLTHRLLRQTVVEARARLAGASMLVTPGGAFIRLADARSFYRRSAVKAATLEKGVVFLWASYESARPIIGIPARLMQPVEQERLLSLGRPMPPAPGLSTSAA